MIELRTLGALDLKVADGHPVHSILAQSKRLALLAYLAVHAAGARRDSVVALFWPELDTAHARGALRQSLRFLAASSVTASSMVIVTKRSRSSPQRYGVTWWHSNRPARRGRPLRPCNCIAARSSTAAS